MVVLYFGMGSLHAHREPPSVINFAFFREGTIKVFTLIVYFKSVLIRDFFQKIFFSTYYVVGTPNLKILLPSLHFFTRWQLVIWQTDHVGKPTL